MKRTIVTLILLLACAARAHAELPHAYRIVDDLETPGRYSTEECVEDLKAATPQDCERVETACDEDEAE